MKYRVWRSLDRPSSFFGIRGKFAYVFLAFATAGAMVSMVIGNMTGGITGMLAFACCCIADYMLVTSLQGKTSDDSDVFRRAITRLMDAADDQSLSAERLRELITNEFETCLGLQTEEEVMEEIERMREEYEHEGNDEDDRQFLLDEQERIYRDCVL